MGAAWRGGGGGWYVHACGCVSVVMRNEARSATWRCLGKGGEVSVGDLTLCSGYLRKSSSGNGLVLVSKVDS